MIMLEKAWWVMAVFGSIFANIIIMIYFQLGKLATMEELLSDVKLVHLNDCRCISDARRMWDDGIIGRQMRMNMVTVLLTFPNLMYLRGDISKDANLRVPPHLRAWILWLHIILNTVFVCMIGRYAFITAQ
ncbi:hypothetical protein [Pseudomonas sp. CFBP 8772]|uniref:hypothetical protein n=1 Tax=Pseudomonas sp. CFBP 8772 TaxID=2775284 RepID=UPI00177B6D28|nr:hypothetical protein [Pseudomonas sp. CFBP 8772]MBD8598658.1 hypothetical protein [Pseudomonas sp. CFBP 8772]